LLGTDVDPLTPRVSDRIRTILRCLAAPAAPL